MNDVIKEITYSMLQNEQLNFYYYSIGKISNLRLKFVIFRSRQFPKVR